MLNNLAQEVTGFGGLRRGQGFGARLGGGGSTHGLDFSRRAFKPMKKKRTHEERAFFAVSSLRCRQRWSND
jgi:hypothetical protein